MKFPVGIETFDDIRSHGYVYIDKTGLIHQLIENGKYYFLSRPRRFGKSLLLSTIRAYFEGKRELFRGLEIEKHSHDWAPHPVFHLNLIGFGGDDAGGLESMLERQFSRWEDIYGRNSSEKYFADRFSGLIERAVEQTSQKAVILIDEYDKPLVSSLDDKENHDHFRNILKPIYSNLKSQDRNIRFGMITGVSRFSRMSIFSDINNLRDISLSNDFSAICGITEREMLEGCRDAIAGMADANGWSFDETVAKLKSNYDGYHFAEKSEDIYNPFSLFSALTEKKTGAYWYATGTPTFLVKRMQSRDFRLPDLENKEIASTSLLSSDTYLDSPAALLFQTGYLTICGYDPRFDIYSLKIPNREVRDAIIKSLIQKGPK